MKIFDGEDLKFVGADFGEDSLKGSFIEFLHRFNLKKRYKARMNKENRAKGL